MTAAAGNKTYAQTSLSIHAPPHLPCNLVEEILCRLPVKNLRQLCCVSKSWNSLISGDSKFAKKHLRFSTLSHDRQHLSLRSSLRFRIWKSPISSFFSSEAAASTDDSLTQLSHPLIKLGYDYDVVSTCDGILCFGINESLALLCNPSIRKFNPLPPLNINSGLIRLYSQTLYTVVYDRFIHNYKIIAVSSCLPHDDKYKKQVNVHTLGTDYWRKIQDFPIPCHYFHSNTQGIFVSDTVNWLVMVYDNDTCSSSSVIVSLDLKNESYQQLLQPLYHESSFLLYNILGTLRDCLCVFSHTYKCSDIWIMKEYGNEKSWIKLFKVPYFGASGFWIHTKPLYIYEDDRVLLWFVKTGKFILTVIDSKNNTFKTHQIDNSLHEWEIPKVFIESLISPY